MRGEPGPIYDAMRRWLDGEPVPPLAEFLDRFGRNYRNYRLSFDDVLAQDETVTASFLDRAACIGAYGFALPCAELIEACVKQGKLIEIGAGSGALARLIANAGGDIVATDLNAGHSSYGFEIGRWFPVAAMDAAAAVIAHPDRTVFCSWPSLNQDWFYHALRAVRPGQGVIVIRESACADDAAWAYFDGRAFEDIETIEIPCWTGMHDIAEGRRKKQRKARS